MIETKKEDIMDTKPEIRKYLSYPMLLIGSGSFFGVIGWMGLANAADSLLFFFGSMLLSLSGTMTTLCGLMSLERFPPSKQKIRQLKSDTSKHLKIHYPTYILEVDKAKEKYKELFEQLQSIRTYYEAYRQEVRHLRSELTHIDKKLQQNLKDNAPIIDNDSVDAIARKLLWSEKQIQLAELNEQFEKLAQSFSSIDLEQYRDKLTYVSRDLIQFERGIEYYRELLILCSESHTKYGNLINAKRKVERVDILNSRLSKRLVELETEMDTKCEEVRIELSLFRERLENFKKDVD